MCQNPANARAGGLELRVKRASTRLTLPSRMAKGRSKAEERMLPAVLRPMPGRANQPSRFRGQEWPSNCLAPWCRRRARE